jgi:hypothetical protein
MQRFDRIGRGTGFICVSAASLAIAAMSLRVTPDLRNGGLSNPDTYMRLVRLRETLRVGHSVYIVARDGSGHGTLLHWSHLLDSLLCVLALPFSFVLDQETAIHAAALLFGPLCIAALGFAIAWAAAPFAERKWLWLGALLPALSPSIASYGLAGVVHHHVPIVIVVVACWGWAARLITRQPDRADGGEHRADGIALGVWAAVGIWLTPESVPLTMMAFAALFLAWALSPAREDLAHAIRRAGIAFSFVTLLALLVDPPAAGVTAAEIDRLSLLFAGLALAVAAIGIGLASTHRFVRARPARFAIALAIGLLCSAAWAAAFGRAIFRSDTAENMAKLDAMFGRIAEMLPIVGPFQQLQFLLTGGLALLLAAVMAVRLRSLLLTYVAACLALLLLLGMQHVRFAAYPEAAGAIALPIALTLTGRATESWHQIGQSFIRLATIMLFIQVPYLGALPDLTSSAHAAMVETSACRIADAVPMLARHPGAVVLADVNDTPEILYKTDVRTVGSLYHRDIDAFLRLRAAWRVAPSDIVPAEIDAAEISLVLGCKHAARSAVVLDLTRPNLVDQLRAGNPPPWLRQIDANPVSGHVLYEVVNGSR